MKKNAADDSDGFIKKKRNEVTSIEIIVGVESFFPTFFFFWAISTLKNLYES